MDNESRIIVIKRTPRHATLSSSMANEIASSEILVADADTGVHSNPTVKNKRETNGLVLVDCVEDSLIGKYCVVVYDRMPYPGAIMDVDDCEQIEVKVMCRTGPYRFFWPLVEDRLGYSMKCVITIMDEEPELVTKRHGQIPPHLWSLMVKKT